MQRHTVQHREQGKKINREDFSPQSTQRSRRKEKKERKKKKVTPEGSGNRAEDNTKRFKANPVLLYVCSAVIWLSDLISAFLLSVFSVPSVVNCLSLTVFLSLRPLRALR
jgi:hypothetical protein